MAHAEMNALAHFDGVKAEGCDLYTTLQPCLMCSAAAVFMHVDRVHFAASDEFFEGVEDLWEHHPYAQRWRPAHVGPLNGPLSSFAKVLPLSVQALMSSESRSIAVATERTPDIASLAGQLAYDGTLRAIADAGGEVTDALEAVWARLPIANT